MSDESKAKHHVP